MPIVLKFSGKPINPPALLGDGILFFFSLVLTVGLFSDVLKDMQLRPPRMHPNAEAAVLMGLFVIFSAAWIGYFIALLQRLNGRSAGALLSVVLAILTLVFIFGVRLSFGLW